MTSSTPTTYPDWKAPREDGQTLIWPEPAQLLTDTTENHTRLSASDVRIQNAPLNELRRAARTWIGHADDAQPLIADGHQTELHHPGVWVKRVLSHFAASRLSASAAHFAIDTDAPKHLTLRWLGGAEPITDDPRLNDVHWSGTLDAPSPAHLASLESKVGRLGMVGEFLVSLRRLALERPMLSAALTNAMHELDWSLEMRHHAYLASPIWSSEVFLTFAHHVIARAGEFAADYNAALADYRRAKKVRSNMRPMPDLAVLDESVELPFWLDELSTGNRTRPSAFAREGGGYVMTAPGGDELVFDPSSPADDAARRLAEWLRHNDLRLAPRALTLTMFLRLFVVDQFVHGIGGGQYDQVTDRIIAAHFQLDPPRFAVATGTMYQPQSLGRVRACVPCVLQEGHHLRHSLLGPERKRELVSAIEALPRCSAERYAAFASMHRELNAAAATSPAVARWERRLSETRASEMEESALFDRELFYALQPRERLEQMVRRFSQSFT
jgi:hypothetical protein